MDLDLVLPGHGDPIDDHRSLIDERFRMHARRAEKLHGLIAERPRTAHELAQALWGNIAVTQAYLTLSEVLGHTDLLVNEGRVREVEDDGVVRFEAVTPRPAGGLILRGHDRARRAARGAPAPRANAPAADAGDREPVRHHGLGPAAQPGGVRAAVALLGRGDRHREARARHPAVP